MQIIVKTKPEELKRAQGWWHGLEMQWKFAYNEAIFGKGPVLEPPKDDELMLLLVRADTLRFAGPLAHSPNMTTKLTNLSGLIPLYHLHYLSLTNTDITSIQELTRHTKLQHLFLYDNKITSLDGIQGMKNLKDLYIQNNQITSLKPLKKIKGIQKLYACSNQLTSLDGITKKHANHMKEFTILPNESLKDRDIIQFQNKVGIICKKG